MGVIIVGIAIAVGITIFNNQAYNNSRQAVATELNTYGTNAMQWWKTPKAQGGAGRDFDAESAADNIAKYIGFGADSDAVYDKSNTGLFKVISAVDANTVKIQGISPDPKAGLYLIIEATIDLEESTITMNTAAGTSETYAFPA